jgi:hypothetical protein
MNGFAGAALTLSATQFTAASNSTNEVFMLAGGYMDLPIGTTDNPVYIHSVKIWATTTDANDYFTSVIIKGADTVGAYSTTLVDLATDTTDGWTTGGDGIIEWTFGGVDTLVTTSYSIQVTCVNDVAAHIRIHDAVLYYHIGNHD